MALAVQVGATGQHGGRNGQDVAGNATDRNDARILAIRDHDQAGQGRELHRVVARLGIDRDRAATDAVAIDRHRPARAALVADGQHVAVRHARSIGESGRRNWRSAAGRNRRSAGARDATVALHEEARAQRIGIGCRRIRQRPASLVDAGIVGSGIAQGEVRSEDHGRPAGPERLDRANLRIARVVAAVLRRAHAQVGLEAPNGVAAVLLQSRQAILQLVGSAGRAEQADDADAKQQSQGQGHHRFEQGEAGDPCGSCRRNAIARVLVHASIPSGLEDPGKGLQVGIAGVVAIKRSLAPLDGECAKSVVGRCADLGSRAERSSRRRQSAPMHSARSR